MHARAMNEWSYTYLKFCIWTHWLAQNHTPASIWWNDAVVTVCSDADFWLILIFKLVWHVALRNKISGTLQLTRSWFSAGYSSDSATWHKQNRSLWIFKKVFNQFNYMNKRQKYNCAHFLSTLPINNIFDCIRHNQ